MDQTKNLTYKYCVGVAIFLKEINLIGRVEKLRGDIMFDDILKIGPCYFTTVWFWIPIILAFVAVVWNTIDEKRGKSWKDQ